jgi:hypothetical protein
MTTLYLAGAKKHQQLARQEGGFAMCYSSRCSDGPIIFNRQHSR